MSHKMFDLSLMLAETMGAVRRGAATGGSETTVVDSSLNISNDEYNGGVLWMTAGVNDEFYDPITDCSADTITFENARVTPIAAGDEYAIANYEFSMNILMSAINSVVTTKLINQVNNTLVTVADQESYTLPTGVSRVRRVEIAQNDSAPYNYRNHYRWVEEGGVLRFLDDLPAEDDLKIKIGYVVYHSMISATVELSEQFNLEWVKWAAALNAWRTYIQRSRRDNPIAVELFNEALQREGELRPLMRLEPLYQLSMMMTGDY